MNIYTNKKSVGFDFDGVIHKNVHLPDRFGQRHPSVPFNTVPPTKFDKIINLIKIYILIHIIVYRILLNNLVYN